MLNLIKLFISNKKYYFFTIFIFLVTSYSWFNKPLSYTDLDFWTFWDQVAKSKFFNLFLISPVAGLGGYSAPISFWLNPIVVISYFLGGENQSLFIAKFLILSLELLSLYLIAIKLNFNKKFNFILLVLNLLFSYSLFSVDNSFFIFENLVSISILRVFILFNTYFLLKTEKLNSIKPYLYAILFVIWAVLVNPMYYGIYFIYPILILSVYKLLNFLDTKEFKSFRYFIITVTISLFIIGIIGYSFSFNSARSVFGNEIYSEIQNFDYLNVFIFRFKAPISILFILISILSCISLIYDQTSKNIKFFSISILVVIFVDVIIGILYSFSGIIWKYPSPLYFEQSLIPFLLIPIALVFSYKSQTNLKKIIIILSTLLLFTLFILRFNPISLYNKYFKSNNITEQAYIKSTTNNSISFILQNQLKNKNNYNGSVARLFFIPGSPISNRYGNDSSFSFSKVHLEMSNELIKNNFDDNLNLSNLWKLDIPTLEDNNHMVSPFKYYFFSRLLARPHDYQSRNWLLATKFEKNIFQLLGVKYLLTDYKYNLFLESKIENNFGILNLYKLDSINLGNYNPKNIITINNAKDFINLVKDKNINFKRYAYIHKLDTNGISKNLVDATSIKFNYNGVDDINFSALSHGNSLVILPLEYRHTMKIKGDGNYKIIRVNLFLTGIYFRGNVNLNISSYSNYNIISGLLEDKKDQNKYKLISDSAVNYPHNFQPHSIFKNSNLNIFSLFKPEFYIEYGGLWILLLIIFAETGFFIGFFLPGDSLLFLCGIYSKDLVVHNFPNINNSNFQLILLSSLIFISAILGNIFGYYFGKKVGSSIYNWKDNIFFKKKFLIQTNDFYNKNGKAAVFIARFIPIVRTFVPILAGVIKMDFKEFMKYNLIGAFIWSFLLTFAGHYFQKLFLINFDIDLKKHIELIILSIVFLSIIPLIIKYVKRNDKLL
jgi:membrane-associated protein